jgi:hypothetical protein
LLAVIIATLPTYYLIGQFEAIKTKTSITADLGSLLTSLQPNLQVEIVSETLSAQGALDITLKLTNRGVATMNVSEHNLVLSLGPINVDSGQGRFLTPGKDYELVGNVVSTGYAPPGAVLKQAISVVLKGRMPPSPLYYVVGYTAETDRTIRLIMRQSLGETLGAFGRDLDSLAKARFNIASVVERR